MNQIGQETLTVGATAESLTVPTGSHPKRVLIYIGGQPVRWRADGTAPTATAGMYVAAGSYIDWTELATYTSLVDRVQFIRDTAAGGDATLEIAYFD